MKKTFLAHYADFLDEYYLAMILSVRSKLIGGNVAAALQVVDDLEDDAEDAAIFFLQHGDLKSAGLLNDFATCMRVLSDRIRKEIRA